MKYLRAVVASLQAFADRVADWYWRDPIEWRRRLVEEDARRLGGRVVWYD